MFGMSTFGSTSFLQTNMSKEDLPSDGVCVPVELKMPQDGLPLVGEAALDKHRVLHEVVRDPAQQEVRDHSIGRRAAALIVQVAGEPPIDVYFRLGKA